MEAYELAEVQLNKEQFKRDNMEKETKEFVWTDELIKEFVANYCKGGHYINVKDPVMKEIDRFIKSKAKEKEKPLFIADDGVGIYAKDTYYDVLSDWSIREWRTWFGTPVIRIRATFSTERAAKEYVLSKKPKETPECFYVVNKDWSVHRISFVMAPPCSSSGIYFTTEEEAKEYVKMNQPRYSITDIDRLKEKWLYGDSPTDFKSFLIKEAK